MQVRPIQQNFNNNYSLKSNQNQKQNPTFGKLIVDEEVPTEILKSITESDEIKELVKMLHNDGADLRVSMYDDIWDANDYAFPYSVSFDAVKGEKDVSITFFESDYVFEIAQEIDSLKSGFAEKTFNKYIEKIKEKAAKEALEKNRANYIEDIDSFNKTFKRADAPKPKWWQFWKR